MKRNKNQKPSQISQNNNEKIDYQSQVESVIPIPEEFKHYYYQNVEKNYQNTKIQQKIFNNAQQVSNQLKVICLIGITGTGKSTTANSICGVPGAFQESAKMVSCTQETTGKFFKWPTKENQDDQEKEEDQEQPFLVIDTPGLCDNNGRDTENIVKMVCFLKNIAYVNSFVICFNSQDPRLDDNKQSILRLFIEMFGKQFFQNIILCFTRWGYDKKSEKQRKKQNQGQTEVISQMKQQFIDKLQTEIEDDQFIFIDNYYSNPENAEECEEQELQKHQEQLEILRQITLENEAFWCKDLKSVQKENQKLQEQIKKQEEYLKQQQEEFQKNLEVQKKEQQQIIEELQKQKEEENKVYQQNLLKEKLLREQEKNEILQKQQEQQSFISQQSSIMESKIQSLENTIIQQKQEMQEYQQKLKQDQEQSNENFKSSIQQMVSNIEDSFTQKLEQSQISQQQQSVIGITNQSQNQSGSFFESIFQQDQQQQQPKKKHDGPRCLDGSLDMRFAVNRGKNKYLD